MTATALSAEWLTNHDPYARSKAYAGFPPGFTRDHTDSELERFSTPNDRQLADGT